MTVQLKKPVASATPVHLVDKASFQASTQGLPAATRQWMATTGFVGAPDTHALVPDAEGRLAAVWAGVKSADHPYALAALPRAVPEGRYRLGAEGLKADPQAAALSFAYNHSGRA